MNISIPRFVWINLITAVHIYIGIKLLDTASSIYFDYKEMDDKEEDKEIPESIKHLYC